MNTVIGILILASTAAGPSPVSSAEATTVAPDASVVSFDVNVVAATPFELLKPYPSSSRRDRPIVESGFVVVLRSGRGLVEPRAVATPVLYAGSEVVEIVYRDPEAGIVAGVVRARKSLAGIDLWWGSPRYAESVDSQRVASERRVALEAGLVPVPGAVISQALSATPDGRTFADRGALYRFATDLAKSAALSKP